MPATSRTACVRVTEPAEIAEARLKFLLLGLQAMSRCFKKSQIALLQIDQLMHERGRRSVLEFNRPGGFSDLTLQATLGFVTAR